jgi:hypothetical protein
VSHAQQELSGKASFEDYKYAEGVYITYQKVSLILDSLGYYEEEKKDAAHNRGTSRTGEVEEEGGGREEKEWAY